MLKYNKKSGFSFMELVVVIAVLAVLLAVLAPSLLSYMELSRMQKDDSAMEEVVNAVQLAISDSATFDEVYSYCIPNNYVTYTDSSGKYANRTMDEEFWAPDGSGPAVTITFNPDENGNYDIGKGIVNDTTYGNGSVAEKRTAEGDLKQCYFEEMGNQLLYSAVKQSIGNTISETSATYKNSSYTVFIRYYLVDGTRKADVYGAFNGTNLSEECPAAIGSNTSSYDKEDKPISTTPTGGKQESNYTNSDLSGGGSIGGIITRPSYKPCDHPSFEQFDKTYHQCSVSDCKKQFEHEYPETGLTAKCTVCEYIKDHTCTFDKNNICTQCGEEKTVNFTITKSNCYQAGITSLEGDIVIPKTFTYNGTKYRVTSIGNQAFYNCSSLTSIEIPDSVTSIGICAFLNCSSLTSINIPDGVTLIGESAFNKCSSLTSITIPDSVTTIGNEAFRSCSNLASIIIPDSVTSIGYSAFKMCSSLISVQISNGIASIGDKAFDSCTSLTSITIPSSVTGIGEYAFYGCSSLTSITIPDSVTSIRGYAFMDCTSLTSITIPNNVTSIENRTFSNCSSLTSINIPDGVTRIGDSAFSSCSSLTSITIPDSVTSISYYAFNSCSNLTSINIPDGVTRIENYTFWYCGSLTDITIPDSVTSIGNYAFSSCSSLKTITFQGTKTQWNAITKSNTWKHCASSSCIVHCTDGNILISNA